MKLSSCHQACGQRPKVGVANPPGLPGLGGHWDTLVTQLEAKLAGGWAELVQEAFLELPPPPQGALLKLMQWRKGQKFSRQLGATYTETPGIWKTS